MRGRSAHSCFSFIHSHSLLLCCLITVAVRDYYSNIESTGRLECTLCVKIMRDDLISQPGYQVSTSQLTMIDVPFYPIHIHRTRRLRLIVYATICIRTVKEYRPVTHRTKSSQTKSIPTRLSSMMRDDVFESSPDS